MTYAQYCIRRGYKPPFKGWPVIKRSLLESWLQPGFHRFWRVWNPPAGYLLFQLYKILGGNRNHVVATCLVFICSGVLHDLAGFIINPRWGPIFTISYFVFAVLSLLSSSLQSILKQKKWPQPVNLLINAGIVVGIFETSTRFIRI